MLCSIFYSDNNENLIILFFVSLHYMSCINQNVLNFSLFSNISTFCNFLNGSMILFPYRHYYH